MKNVATIFWQAVFAIGLASCSDDESPSGTTFPALPQNFKIVGEASGNVDGLSIDCLCDLNIELEGEPEITEDMVEYHGVHGGYFRRRVLDQPDGNGIAIEPDVYGEIVVRLFSPDSIVFIIPVNIDVESSFYRETAHFRGVFKDTELGKGRWNCAPFDINEGGWVDTLGVVEGEWRIEESLEDS